LLPVVLAALTLAACDTGASPEPGNPLVGTWVNEEYGITYVFTENTYTEYLDDDEYRHGYYSIGSKLVFHGPTGENGVAFEYYIYDNKLYLDFTPPFWEAFIKQL
jgi:hypothetical protein